MKEKEIVLMSYLRQDGRISLTKLSKKTGIPVSTIFQKLKNNLNNSIVKHTSLIDFAAIGYGLKAFLLFRVKKDQKDSLLQHMSKCFHVNNLFKINNSWDLMAECIFKDLNNLEEFLETIENSFSIKSKEVHYVLADLKREVFLTNPEMLNLTEKT